MAEITSRLWKAAQLALHSTYFPAMVQAACWYTGKTYSQALLFKVSINQALLDAIDLEEGETIDVALMHLMQNFGGQVDGAITTAVQNYTEPGV